MNQGPSENDGCDISGIADIAEHIDGIPLPPVVKRSLFKSAGRLVGSATDLGTAWLEAKADGIRATAEARRIAKIGMAKKVPGYIEADEQLAARAVAFIGGEMLREQANRDGVLKHAVEDLQAGCPSQDAKHAIEDDWLHMFIKEASAKSNDEMQLLFGRILAGEIRAPGTFSLRSIRTLALIDTKTARLFERLCNMSCDLEINGIHLLDAPFTPSLGHAGQNSLQEFGLHFPALNRLHEAGLIVAEYDAGFDMAALPISGLPFDLGGERFFLRHSGEPNPNERLQTVLFSSAGAELRRIVSMKPMIRYVERFAEFLAIRKYELCRVLESLPDGKFRIQPVRRTSSGSDALA